jgi:hypothetical protein
MDIIVTAATKPENVESILLGISKVVMPMQRGKRSAPLALFGLSQLPASDRIVDGLPRFDLIWVRTSVLSVEVGPFTLKCGCILLGFLGMLCPPLSLIFPRSLSISRNPRLTAIGVLVGISLLVFLNLLRVFGLPLSLILAAVLGVFCPPLLLVFSHKTTILEEQRNIKRTIL